MVGRTLEGDPLVRAYGKNEFTYDGDDNGLRCPFGAHVRRANPRTADYPAGVQRALDKLIHQLALKPRKFRDDLMASDSFSPYCEERPRVRPRPVARRRLASGAARRPGARCCISYA